LLTSLLLLPHAPPSPLVWTGTSVKSSNNNRDTSYVHKLIQVPPSYSTRQRDGITLPQRITFLTAYKVLHMPLFPSKTKETVFQKLNRTIWTQNKAVKSDRAPDALCYRCDEVETMEHLLYCCEHYSAKIWDLP
jgi:hypothetical protein